MKLLCFFLLAVCSSVEGLWKLTWEAEGNDNPRSPYFSRKLHVPSSRSGLTLGRGYDMRDKSKSLISKDLTKAGIEKKYVDILSKASGLRGASARVFIKKNNLKDFVISHSSQERLFGISIDRKIKTAKRIFNKPLVVKYYGRADWDKLDSSVQELVVDLLYRGDYSPTTRKFLQKSIVKNDVKNLCQLMSNRKLWSNVPYDRFKRRRDHMKRA